MPTQLALPFPERDRYDPADFVAGAANAAALAWLDSPWPAHRLLVWGEPGAGKTHFLRLWAQRAGALLAPAAMLDGLIRMPARGGLAVDDADRAAEEPLLHLLNAAGESGLPVLLAAARPPARWAVRLPDLASRLRAVTAVELGTPDEAMRRTLFASVLAGRQLDVPEHLQTWLLLRLPREPGALRDAAARLDAAVQEAGRKVTYGMAARIVRDAA